MRYISILMVIFLLSALAIGSQLGTQGLPTQNITKLFDSQNITEGINITAPDDSNSYVVGFYEILESLVNFIITSSMEVMKIGVSYGAEHPSYFEPNFILGLVRLIIWLIIIFLLIKPLSYLVVILVLLGIWIKDKFTKNNQKPKGGKNNERRKIN